TRRVPQPMPAHPRSAPGIVVQLFPRSLAETCHPSFIAGHFPREEIMLMPAENRTAIAAHTFQQNANLLEECFGDLEREEWLRRPAEKSNPVLWIVGHVIWSRSRVLALLGEEWTRPWLPLFQPGARCGSQRDAGHAGRRKISELRRDGSWYDRVSRLPRDIPRRAGRLSAL